MQSCSVPNRRCRCSQHRIVWLPVIWRVFICRRARHCRISEATTSPLPIQPGSSVSIHSSHSVIRCLRCCPPPKCGGGSRNEKQQSPPFWFFPLVGNLLSAQQFRAFFTC